MHCNNARLPYVYYRGALQPTAVRHRQGSSEELMSPSLPPCAEEVECSGVIQETLLHQEQPVNGHRLAGLLDAGLLGIQVWWLRDTLLRPL